MQHTRPALFLDRDGVINEDIGYLHRVDEVRFMPGVEDLIRTANGFALPVIIVTNQAGIGRGLYSEAQFRSIMTYIETFLARNDASLAATYYSPFHPEHGIGDYRRETECRKPRPGMLLRAAHEHSLDLASSVMVGDRCTDMLAAQAAGVPHRFLIAGTEPAGCPDVPHTQVTSLAEVTKWLVGHYAPQPNGSAPPHAIPA